MTDLSQIPLTNLIDEMESRIEDPSVNLPYELFLFMSRNITIVNVDIFVRHPAYGTLLAWRDDSIYGKGWHVPGRVMRFKNTREEALRKCLESEFGITNIDPSRLRFMNAFDMFNKDLKRRPGGLTLVYELILTDEEAEYTLPKSVAWFKEMPKDMIAHHSDKYNGISIV